MKESKLPVSLKRSNDHTSDWIKYMRYDIRFWLWYLNDNRFGITKSQICMVGDRLDTDILFGQNGGCKTLLVLSGDQYFFIITSSSWYQAHMLFVLTKVSFYHNVGVTSLSMLENPNNSIQPDFYTSKISDFLSLKAATVWGCQE